MTSSSPWREHNDKVRYCHQLVQIAVVHFKSADVKMTVTDPVTHIGTHERNINVIAGN